MKLKHNSFFISKNKDKKQILTFPLLFLSFLLFSGVLSAQNTPISISIQSVPIRDFFDSLEKKSNYKFSYRDADLKDRENVTISVQNESVQSILNRVLTPRNLQYKINGNKIVVTPLHQSGPNGKFKATGSVRDAKGEALIGVSISVQGDNSRGAITDLDGNFSLDNISDDAVLNLSYIGYQSQQLLANSDLNVVLKEDTKVLDEVVVVGFGTQKKVNLTGAVSAVKMDEVLGDRPVTGLGAALQGSIPGFTTSSSVVPGGGNTFNIRGEGSISGGSPLVLVDNVVFNDLYLLNPADIESVSVLKDASSAAIYGARASFGVVLITTKKGKKGERLSIGYNNNLAVSSVENLPRLASPLSMVQTLKAGGYSSIWSGQNIDTYINLLQDYSANPSTYSKGWTEVNGTKYFLQQNDVMGDMFESAFKQTHNISAQGGSETIMYRLSLGYTDEDGILVTNKDSFKKTNVSSFVSGDITSWLTTSLDIKYNTGKKHYPYLDSTSELGLWKLNLPSYHPVGNLPYGTDGEEYPVMTPSNIIRLCRPNSSVTDDTRLLSRTVLKPFDGLEATLEYSYQFSNEDFQSYANLFQVHQGLAESIKPSTKTTPFTSSRTTTKYTTINAFLSYNKSVSDMHNISALAGFNQEYNNYRYLYSQAYNMISNELPSLSGTDGSTPPDTKDSYSKFALRSAFFRATYNYAQKYFVEYNGRYDLSSKFPKAYRGGFFPSVSLGWNLVKEEFLGLSDSPFSNLKLRGSYGVLGNQNVGNYGYYASMNVVDANWIFNGNIPKTEVDPAMIRATYTWEKVKTINGGIDFGLLKNRLTGSLDMYRRITTGMLGPSEEFPAVAGAVAPTQNSANMKTNGWELAMNWKDNVGSLNYGIGFNLYDARSYITKYKNETKSLSAAYYEGQELGEIWGYVTDGFYTADDFQSSGAFKDGVVQINGVSSHVGDIKYKNLMDDESSTNVIDNGDNTVANPGDRKVIGNNKSRFQYGINGFADYKGFGLSFILQGVGKRDYWMGGNIIFPMSDQYGTVYADQVGKIWTEDNVDNAYFGRIYENAGSSQGANQRTQTKFLCDASYLRVKNITLSYRLPQSWLNMIQLKNLKVFVSGENLFTIDQLPAGIDPESMGWTYPHYRTVSFGINLNL